MLKFKNLKAIKKGFAIAILIVQYSFFFLKSFKIIYLKEAAAAFAGSSIHFYLNGFVFSVMVFSAL